MSVSALTPGAGSRNGGRVRVVVSSAVSSFRWSSARFRTLREPAWVEDVLEVLDRSRGRGEREALVGRDVGRRQRAASVDAQGLGRAALAGRRQLDRRGRRQEVPDRRRGAVAEHRAGGQHRRPQPAPVVQARVADRVDASVDPVELATGETAFDRAAVRAPSASSCALRPTPCWRKATPAIAWSMGVVRNSSMSWVSRHTPSQPTTRRPSHPHPAAVSSRTLSGSVTKRS